MISKLKQSLPIIQRPFLPTKLHQHLHIQCPHDLFRLRITSVRWSENLLSNYDPRTGFHTGKNMPQNSYTVGIFPVMEDVPQQKNICLVTENRLRIEERVWRKEDAGLQLGWDFAVCTGLQFCAVLNDYAQVGICGCEGDANEAIGTANLVDDVSTRHDSADTGTLHQQRLHSPVGPRKSRLPHG